MKISELQNIFIDELEGFLHRWKFIKKHRHFKKVNGNLVWYLHISCINHFDDFDVKGDVAVEFKDGKKRLAIIGAELGNIAGSGPKRFPVGSVSQAYSSAVALHESFQKIGLPFIERFSNPDEVVTVLKDGGKEAGLISPLSWLHQEQIIGIDEYINKNFM